MECDVIITAEMAIEVQHQGQQQGALVIWTVAWNPSDYHQKATARPHFIQAKSMAMSHTVLVADSLDALRRMLPPGLSVIDRDPADDPVIVEVWL